VLMARLATHKMETEEDFDATRCARGAGRLLRVLAARVGVWVCGCAGAGVGLGWGWGSGTWPRWAGDEGAARQAVSWPASSTAAPRSCPPPHPAPPWPTLTHPPHPPHTPNRAPQLARPRAHPPGGALRRVPQGRPGLLHAAPRALLLPAVHVQPAPLAVRAGARRAAGGRAGRRGARGRLGAPRAPRAGWGARRPPAWLALRAAGSPACCRPSGALSRLPGAAVLALSSRPFPPAPTHPPTRHPPPTHPPPTHTPTHPHTHTPTHPHTHTPTHPHTHTPTHPHPHPLPTPARNTQVFGYSPDETAYCRLVLYRVNTPDAMVMIQPQLTAYHFGGAEPVLLDVSSILPERILLLDAYFYVVAFHGGRFVRRVWRAGGRAGWLGRRQRQRQRGCSSGSGSGPAAAASGLQQRQQLGRGSWAAGAPWRAQQACQAARGAASAPAGCHGRRASRGAAMQPAQPPQLQPPPPPAPQAPRWPSGARPTTRCRRSTRRSRRWGRGTPAFPPSCLPARLLGEARAEDGC
jgi:hypothetical protein